MSHDPLILRKKNSPDCLQFEKKKGILYPQWHIHGTVNSSNIQ